MSQSARRVSAFWNEQNEKTAKKKKKLYSIWFPKFIFPIQFSGRKKLKQDSG